MDQEQYSYGISPVTRLIFRVSQNYFTTIIAILILFIVLIDFSTTLWVMSLFVIYPGVILLIYLLRFFFDKMKYHFFDFLAKFVFFHWIVRIFLMRQSNLKIKRVIFYKQFHLLTHFDWDDLKLIIRIVDVDPKINVELSPYGRTLIQKCVQSNFRRYALTAFTKFYNPSLDALIKTILRGKDFPFDLSLEQRQRVYHELTPEQHKYLEQHLPPNHVVLRKINEIHKISVKADLNILK